MNSARFRVLSLATLLIGQSIMFSMAAVAQQNAHEVVKKSLVYIEATGLTTDLQPIKKATGTGFFVDEDGLILTSYHLIGYLEENNAAAQSVKIRVSMGNKNHLDITANIVDAKASADLLLLKISKDELGANDKIVPLRLGQMSDIPNVTSPKLLTSGFRGDDQSPARVGIEATVKSPGGGPGGYTWVLDKGVEGGQSGSPVYVEGQGGAVSVVGVVKGVINEGRDTVFVPISSAESLVLPIRMRELNERIAKLLEQPKFDAQMIGYLGTQGESTPLGSWFNSYIEAHIDKKVDTFLEKYKSNINSRLDGYMKDVVAYSYSSEFSFTGKEDGRKYFTLPFYKAEGDRGDIKCDADFGNVRAIEQKDANGQPKPKKTVPELVKAFYRINDLEEAKIPDPPPKLTVRLEKKLVEKNKSLYYGLDRDSDPEPSPYQQIEFWINKTEVFDGQVTFLCTVLIMGSAKIAQHK